MDKITLKCGTEILLEDLEAAGLSYVPCGQVDGKDQPLLTYSHLWGQRQQVKRQTYGKQWNPWYPGKVMTGVQLMTGSPSYRHSTDSPDGYIYLTDIDMEARLLSKYPDIAHQISTIYREACKGTPCIIETKSGGRRYSAFVAYLAPKREFKDTDDKMLCEFFSLKGLSRLDHRYAMLEGSLLELPTLPKSALQDIYKVLLEVSTEKQHADKEVRDVVGESQLDDLSIEWDSDGKSQYFTSEHCRVTSHRSNRETVRFQQWAGGVQGHCFNCGETWWERPPKRKQHRRPVKLQKKVVSVLTETLEQIRAFLKSVFENKNIKFFGLRADTGVGKNEAAITYFLRGVAGLLTVPTTDLAVEMESRLNAAEVAGVFRYRGILSNPDELFPDENPCIHARRYDAIANRGWNAYQLLCEHCEVRATCEELGYRSQVEQAKQAQVTVMPFPDIFLNPAFRTLAKDYLPTYHEDLILHDEFDPYNAFIEINVPKTRLVQLRDDWEGYDPSAFAKKLLHILEVEGDLPQLRSVVMGLTDAERESILEGFTCVLWNGQILSREDAHRCDAFRAPLHTVEGIHSLPKLETEEWNLIVQLETFFDRYKRDADMPMTYENDTLTFLLPPLPMHTRARMGFMSATLDETLFRRAMDSRQLKRGDVSFHDTGLTEWHPEARVYQLRTNRNPRGTAYTPKGERVDGELLSSTGEFYWGLVAEDLKLPRRGLITYKALIAEKADDMEGIPTANFGGLVGLDTAFKGVDVLHILFSPEVPPSAIERKAKALFGNDTELLCYDRDENGQYIDKRLQACYDDGVIAELIQAIGRGRGVSRPVTVVVWCSHSLPGVTDREQTLLFDEVDWQQAEGNLEKLKQEIQSREEAESSGDIQAYTNTTGLSQRMAYYKTEQKRKQSKAERDNEIRKRSDAGETQQAIADALGISKRTVQRVLTP